MRSYLKYLGVLLDSKMTFLYHFRQIRDKAAVVSRALSRLMPNLRGPSEFKRRLYVVLSVMLYAAPIWREAITRARRNRERLNNIVTPAKLARCVKHPNPPPGALGRRASLGDRC